MATAQSSNGKKPLARLFTNSSSNSSNTDVKERERRMCWGVPRTVVELDEDNSDIDLGSPKISSNDCTDGYTYNSPSSEQHNGIVNSPGPVNGVCSKYRCNTAAIDSPPESRIQRTVLQRSYSDSSHVAPQHRTFNSDLARSQVVMKEEFAKLKNPSTSTEEQSLSLQRLQGIVKDAWATPKYGRDLAYELCDMIRSEDILQLLLLNCEHENRQIQYDSSCLLHVVLSEDNREKICKDIGVKPIVEMSTRTMTDSKMCQTSVAILEGLFAHSESTSCQLIELGALDCILYGCRATDMHIATQRHCAMALTNLAIYGGDHNRMAMVKRGAHQWLFPLALSTDDSTQYYSCLAIAVLLADPKIEAEVAKCDALKQVEPFVKSHSPEQFARSYFYHRQGHSKQWLQRVVHLLKSSRKESKCLAAFHFAMEAFIKAEQKQVQVFEEIGAVEALQNLYIHGSPVTSSVAEKTLRMINATIPKKLKEQVPLWTVEDVTYWVEQVTKDEKLSRKFSECQVDGDLLLRLTESQLKEDISISNGFQRQRFLRELFKLKMRADYSYLPGARGLINTLSNIGPEYKAYAYPLLRAGVNTKLLMFLTDDHLRKDAMIENGIHRLRILQEISRVKTKSTAHPAIDLIRPVDVFISYRREGGAQLASLLKVHLQLRGFSVFLDIEKLLAGRFANRILNSIRGAKHFILILTPNALDRCKGDTDQIDWIHKEVVTAIQSNCNIVPVIDNFIWPNELDLPNDMREITSYQSVKWIHDYQDACVDKLEKFLTDENLKTPHILSSDSPVKLLETSQNGPSSHHGFAFSPQNSRYSTQCSSLSASSSAVSPIPSPSIAIDSKDTSSERTITPQSTSESPSRPTDITITVDTNVSKADGEPNPLTRRSGSAHSGAPLSNLSTCTTDVFPSPSSSHESLKMIDAESTDSLVLSDPEPSSDCMASSTGSEDLHVRHVNQ